MEPNYQSDIEDWLLDHIVWVVGFLAAVILVVSYVFWERVGEQEDQIAEQSAQIVELETEIVSTTDDLDNLDYRISRLEARPSLPRDVVTGDVVTGPELRQCISATLRVIESEVEWGDTGDADYGMFGGETGTAYDTAYSHSHSLESGWFGGAGHTHTTADLISLSTPRSCN